MKCILCKDGLINGRVNHIADLGERIIIIKDGMVDYKSFENGLS